MLSTALEVTGFLLLVAFAYVVWAPLALFVAGAGLVAAGVAYDRKPEA